MPWILTNHTYRAVAPNDFTLATDALDRSSHFHRFCSLLRTGWESLGFGSISNAPAVQVIWGQFHRHLIAGKDSNKMHAHLPRYMCQDPVTVGQFNAKHGVGKSLNDSTLNLNDVFFSHALESLLALSMSQSLIIPVAYSTWLSEDTETCVPRQYIRSIACDCDGMLKVSRKLTV